MVDHYNKACIGNKACITNLIETSDFLTSNIAKKNSVDMILLDFAKAFDKVPHKRLILKLSNYNHSDIQM